MARLEDKIDEVVFGSLKLIREYLQMERALQRIAKHLVAVWAASHAKPCRNREDL